MNKKEEKMESFQLLTKKLQNFLVNERHSITPNPRFDGCSYKDLIENSLYLYIPYSGAELYESKTQKLNQNKIKESQEQVKQQILEYGKTNNLEIVVSKDKRCDSFKCTGHYSDPFKEKEDDKHVFLGKLPENMNGAYVYFLKSENLDILKTIQSRH